MKYVLFLFLGLHISTDWLIEAKNRTHQIDVLAKLKHVRCSKSERFETFKYKDYKKITFASNNYHVTDTFSRVRYIKDHFVFYVREWYSTDYLDFLNKPSDWPKGEVCECIYVFQSKNNGILLQRSERYFQKNQVDSLTKVLSTKPFDTLLLNSITYNRVKGRKGKIVKLRFSQD